MCKIIHIQLFVFTLILSLNTSGQLIWEENFNVHGKGYWADSLGNISHDLTNISWDLNVSNCIFSDENDYAKTVLTNGGRFEVVDSDGELIWMSESIDISDFNSISISFDASETGSNSVNNKKYIQAFYQIDNREILSFQPEYEASGNWSEKKLVQNGVHGNTLNIYIKMNSSYANDRVIIDNIKVEGVDSSLFIPSIIRIMESPLYAVSNDTISISAAIFNKAENIIIDSTLNLNLNNNHFSIFDKSFNNGYYQWKLVSSFAGKDYYSVNIEQNTIAPTDSSITFFKNENVIAKDYFENKKYYNWNLNSEWEISDDSPISGSHSVKHSEKNEEGTSKLIYNNPIFSLDTADYIFTFQVKNGDWDPSSSNSFYFFIAHSNTNHLIEGYAIGVNATGSTDMVSFWKVHNGIADVLLAETLFDWNANQKAQIVIKRTANGEWYLNIMDLTDGISHSCSVYDIEFLIINNLQLVFNYTSSRSGKLWFDNMLFISEETPPFISKVNVIAKNKLQVFFNEAIQLALLNNSNFIIESENGKKYSIYNIDKINDQNIEITTETIDEPNLKIIINNIYDLNGQRTSFSATNFECTRQAELHDIVITELMIDHYPSVGLPETEFIEIYNRSDKYIQLNNWKLLVKEQEILLPAKIIKPGEYIIICDNEFANDFMEYGSVLQLEKFPALLNSASNIKLKSGNSILIEEIKYSEEWYHNNQKNDGGYSLERIDRDRFCNQLNNWVVTDELEGGTPGRKNSRDAINSDIIGPEITGIDIISTNSIEVFFNEAVDSISACTNSNINIPHISITGIEYIAVQQKIIIKLKTALIPKFEYKIEILELFDDCGNLSTGLHSFFTYNNVKRGDVIINEILFNPFSGGADFVELFNKSGANINLNKLKLATRDDSLKFKSIYSLTENHTQFLNNSYMAFTKDSLNILENYYTPSPNNIIQMQGFPSFNNDEGRVVLLNDSLNVIDEFVYNKGMQSEWLNEMDGVSLERISIYEETNIATNWHSASSFVGYATPAYANSQTATFEQMKNSIIFESDIVSPNGDGYHDVLNITISSDNPGYLSNIYIFNANGNLIYQIAKNEMLGFRNEINYDLRASNGLLVPLGTYVVFAELIHPIYKRVLLKKAFHVTDKTN